jgi:hypothetical protein
MDPVALPSVVVAVGVAAVWMVAGALSLFESQRLRLVNAVVFPLGAIASLVLAVVGVQAIAQPAQGIVLALGLPGLPFHLRLDPLAGFFLFSWASARPASRSMRPATSRTKRRSASA